MKHFKVMTKRIEKEIDSLVSSISKVKAELKTLKDNNNSSLPNSIQNCTQQSNTDFSESIKITNNGSTSKNENNAFDDNSCNDVNTNVIDNDICLFHDKDELSDVSGDNDAFNNSLSEISSEDMSPPENEKTKAQSDTDYDTVSDADNILDCLIDDAVASISKNAKHSGDIRNSFYTTGTSWQTRKMIKADSLNSGKEKGMKDADKFIDVLQGEKDESSKTANSTTTAPSTTTLQLTTAAQSTTTLQLTTAAQSTTTKSIPKTKIKYSNSISSNIVPKPATVQPKQITTGNTSTGSQNISTQKLVPSTRASVTSTPTPPLSTVKSPPSSTFAQLPLISTSEFVQSPPVPHCSEIRYFKFLRRNSFFLLDYFLCNL